MLPMRSTWGSRPNASAWPRPNAAARRPRREAWAAWAAALVRRPPMAPAVPRRRRMAVAAPSAPRPPCPTCCTPSASAASRRAARAACLRQARCCSYWPRSSRPRVGSPTASQRWRQRPSQRRRTAPSRQRSRRVHSANWPPAPPSPTSGSCCARRLRKPISPSSARTARSSNIYSRLRHSHALHRCNRLSARRAAAARRWRHHPRSIAHLRCQAGPLGSKHGLTATTCCCRASGFYASLRRCNRWWTSCVRARPHHSSSSCTRTRPTTSPLSCATMDPRSNDAPGAALRASLAALRA
mmetsp:Transcript_53807/g.139049  ORF Transcript_53807/g.139049 Transcript_53807/m.139049 type:complete len:298 (-) Transcript_53807:464-1357(-)